MAGKELSLPLLSLSLGVVPKVGRPVLPKEAKPVPSRGWSQETFAVLTKATPPRPKGHWLRSQTFLEPPDIERYSRGEDTGNPRRGSWYISF